MTLTSRRSATGSASGRAATAGATAAVAVAPRVPSGFAHEEQNLALGGLAKPQLGHAAAWGDAHSMQKFAPGTFCVPQLLQIKLAEAYVG
jgi:hypothetical protein